MTNPRDRIKLMADYQCWCLWDMRDPRNINPDTLPISDALKEQLHAWEAAFDKTLDLDDHTNIGFKSDSEYCSFYELGWQLF